MNTFHQSGLADLAAILEHLMGWHARPIRLLTPSEQDVRIQFPSEQESNLMRTVAHVLKFSPRHEQTLSLLLAGDSEKQVAHKLQISQHTVHVYVKHIYRQCRVNSRGELLALFIPSSGAEVKFPRATPPVKPSDAPAPLKLRAGTTAFKRKRLPTVRVQSGRTPVKVHL